VVLQADNSYGASQVWHARLNGVSRAGFFAVMAKGLLRAGVIAPKALTDRRERHGVQIL
jgi:hypothetical protein